MLQQKAVRSMSHTHCLTSLHSPVRQESSSFPRHFCLTLKAAEAQRHLAEKRQTWDPHPASEPKSSALSTTLELVAKENKPAPHSRSLGWGHKSSELWASCLKILSVGVWHSAGPAAARRDPSWHTEGQGHGTGESFSVGWWQSFRVPHGVSGRLHGAVTRTSKETARTPSSGPLPGSKVHQWWQKRNKHPLLLKPSLTNISSLYYSSPFSLQSQTLWKM